LKKAYLSLGSNIGDREQNLRRAAGLLACGELRILRRSSVYETEPRDLRNQPWFLNAVLEAETTLFPLQLLHRALKVEKEMGRRRTVSKGPRSIDIDILLYANFVISTAGLTVPHPRMEERRFVLDPLAELAPDLRHPISRKTMRELLAATAGQIVRRTGIEL
jgi:2-amino-4-hydroxy-6-hydroxymethyldihydropteridine diphosphokinase